MLQPKSIKLHLNRNVIVYGFFKQLNVHVVILKPFLGLIHENVACDFRHLFDNFLLGDLLIVTKRKGYLHFLCHIDVKKYPAVNYRLENRHKDDSVLRCAYVAVADKVLNVLKARFFKKDAMSTEPEDFVGHPHQYGHAFSLNSCPHALELFLCKVELKLIKLATLKSL